MSNTLPSLAAAQEQISDLFQKRPPVLVEVRFPNMGASSDWYLMEDLKQFQELWQRLARGVELYVVSVWDVPTSPATLSIAR